MVVKVFSWWRQHNLVSVDGEVKVKLTTAEALGLVSRIVDSLAENMPNEDGVLLVIQT